MQPCALVACGHVRSRCAASNVNSLKISIACLLRDSEHLVRLQAESPLRMVEAVLARPAAVFALACRAVHRLEEEMVEIRVARTVPARAAPAERPASVRRPDAGPVRRPLWG